MTSLAVSQPSVVAPCPREFRAAFSLPGFHFAVESDSLEVFDYLQSVFFAFASHIPTGEGAIDFSVHQTSEGCVLEGPRTPRASFSTVHQAADFIQLQASHAALSRTDRYVALHAAGICRGDGALLLVGPSGAGKSTLSAALLRRGYRYLSDEAVLLSRSSAMVRGFPRALGLIDNRLLRENGLNWPDDTSPIHRIEGKRYYKPKDFGAELETGMMPVRALFMLHPRHGSPINESSIHTAGCAPRLLPVERGHAIPLLLHQVFATGPADVILDSIIRLVAGAPSYRLDGACGECLADFAAGWDSRHPSSADDPPVGHLQ